MPEATSLNSTSLSFTDAADNQSAVTYADNYVGFQSTLSASSGITSLNVVRIKAGSDYDILSKFSTLTSDTIKLNDNSLEYDPEPQITLTAPELSDNTSLSLPLTQGPTDSFLQLDSNPVISKWSFPSTSTSTELAWEFGDVKQLWSVAYGDPFGDISSGAGVQTQAPLLPIYRDQATSTNDNPANPPSFLIEGGNVNNMYLGFLTSTASKQAALWWDIPLYLDLYPSIYWDFRVCARINDSNAGGNSFSLFGNDERTGSNMVTTSGGGRAQDNQGICVEIHTDSTPNEVRIWEGSTLKATYTAGTKTFSDNFRIYRLQRKDRVIRYEMFSGGDTEFDSHHFVVEYTLSEGYNPGGTRWGMMGHVSNEANLAVKTSYFEVRTYDST